ncbi:MAG: hypothetical protein IPH87_12235 [Anaerolineae bacterium]|nr:hypothetical protein [Anaerolineae bacterium]
MPDQPDTARLSPVRLDANGNIYLALAVQLKAGLDGIRQQTDPAWCSALARLTRTSSPER